MSSNEAIASGRLRRERAEPVRPAILLAALAIVASLPFVPALQGGWILDDGPLIARNVRVHSFDGWGWWLTHDMWDLDLLLAQRHDRLSYWRPLVLASYAFDWTVGGENPTWFHATNLGLHGLTSVLAAMALRRWTGRWDAAIAGAALFALHPTKAESVAWISGRTDILGTLGILLAGLGISLRLHGKRRGMAIEALGTAVAYLSKEQAVVLPLFAAVEALAVRARAGPGAMPLGRLLQRAVIPQAAVAAAYLVLRQAFLPVRTFQVSSLPILSHAMLVLESLGRYAHLLLWPSDLTLAASAIRTGPDGVKWSFPYALIGALFLTGCLVAAYAARRKLPRVAVGTCLLLATLAPVCNIVWIGGISLTSARFLYVPTLGATLVVAALIVVKPRAGVWLAALLCTALGARAAIRSADFSSRDRFWARELHENPDVPEPVEQAIRRDRRELRPALALLRAQCGQAAAERSFSHRGASATFILDAVSILAEGTPDLDTARLEKLADFLKQVLDSAPVATLALDPVSLSVPRESKAAGRLRARAPELDIQLAEVYARLGDTNASLSHNERAVAECPRCRAIARRASIVAAQNGRFDEARRLADTAGSRSGDAANAKDRIAHLERLTEQTAQAPPALAAQLGFRRDALLGLWGKAYRTLEAHRDAILAGPAPARLTFAEAAFRAGDETEAVAVVRSVLSEEDAEKRLEQWRVATGRKDALPLPEDPFADGRCSLD